MGFDLQLLLLCGFRGISSKCGLKVTILKLVMVSIIAVMFIGALLVTVNSTIPHLDDEGYDKRISGLEKSSNTQNLQGRTWGRVLC